MVRNNTPALALYQRAGFVAAADALLGECDPGEVRLIRPLLRSELERR